MVADPEAAYASQLEQLQVLHHSQQPTDSCACHASLLASSWEWSSFHALLSKPPCRTSLLVLVCAEHGLLRQAGQYRGAASNRRQRERCSRQAAAGARVTIYMPGALLYSMLATRQRAMLVWIELFAQPCSTLPGYASDCLQF